MAAFILLLEGTVNALHRPHIDHLFSGRLSHWLPKLPAAPTARSGTVDGQHAGCTSTLLGRRKDAEDQYACRGAACQTRPRGAAQMAPVTQLSSASTPMTTEIHTK